MTEEECVAIGGHCWQSSNELLMTSPPQSIRTCKHCGKQQTGTPREPMEWR